MAKGYKNYMEQVKHSVSQMVMFNNYVNISEGRYYDGMQPGTIQSLEAGGVYQWYAVELVSNEDEETKKLGIFWDEEFEIYIMPVTHFGTGWTGVNPVDEREREED